MLFLLTACTSPSFDSNGSFDVDADAKAVRSGTPVPLTVDVGDAEGILEIRPLRELADGTTEAGSALVTAATDPAGVTLQLPNRAPRRDLDETDLDAPVLYRLAVRATGADGAAREYLGVSETEIIYYPSSDLASDMPAGWVLQGIDGSPSILAAGITISENLVAAREMTLYGDTYVEITEDSHFALVAKNGAIQTDQRAGEAWTMAMTHAPRSETLEADGGANMELVVYEDTDGDQAMGETEVEFGVACVGDSAVTMSWYPPPHLLEDAVSMLAGHHRVGWDMVRNGEVSVEAVPVEAYGTVRIEESCGAIE